MWVFTFVACVRLSEARTREKVCVSSPDTALLFTLAELQETRSPFFLCSCRCARHLVPFIV